VLKIFIAYLGQGLYYPQEIRRRNIMCKFGLETTRKMFQSLELSCDKQVVERHNNLEKHSYLKNPLKIFFPTL